MASMTTRIEAINAALLDTFREEASDGIDQLEARLLELVTRRDPELVDQMFRVAHTIKGGAGTFAMTAMTRVAHRMESVLDAYRTGAAPSQAAVNVLLEGADALRGLLAAGPGGGAPDEFAALESKLEAVAQRARGAPEPGAAALHGERTPATQLAIAIAPSRELFRAQVDPVPLFDQLAMLGELSVRADVSKVPAFAELDPTSCHLAWQLTLTGGPAEMVSALFGWLDELCAVTVEPIAPAAPPVATAAPRGELAAPAVAQVSAGSGPPAASIRVRLDKLDALMNLIGDLMTTQSTLSALGRAAASDPIRQRSALDELQRLTRSLQQSALQLRSMPISSVLNRFPRLVYDLAERLGKAIELEVIGEATELDRTVLERIGDPLVHLLRNSIDHGIEPPAERVAAGKPPAGQIRITVSARSDEVVIEIADDGRGLDTAKILARARERGLAAAARALSDDEIHRLILLPGFSTADQISEISGRGVGMDVVVRTIQELGGDLQLRSIRGAGSTTVLRLPLSLAVMDGQLVQFGGRTWIVPLASVAECTRFDARAITELVGQRTVIRVGDELVPVLDPCARLGIASRARHNLVLVVEANGQRRALLVDEVGPRHQIVVKSLSAQLARVDALSGAAVLGDGSLAFIVDVAALCSATEQETPRMTTTSRR